MTRPNWGAHRGGIQQYTRKITDFMLWLTRPGESPHTLMDTTSVIEIDTYWGLMNYLMVN